MHFRRRPPAPRRSGSAQPSSAGFEAASSNPVGSKCRHELTLLTNVFSLRGKKQSQRRVLHFSFRQSFLEIFPIPTPPTLPVSTKMRQIRRARARPRRGIRSSPWSAAGGTKRVVRPASCESCGSPARRRGGELIRKVHFSKMHVSKMHFSKMDFSKMHFSKNLQICGGLVLGCIKTKFCKKIFV